MIARLRRSDVLLHGAIVFGGIFVASAFNYLFYMLIGRVTSVETYGEVLALSSAMLLIGAPSMVGQLVVARVAADLEARADRAALRRLSDLVTAWMLVAGAATVLAAFLGREGIARFLHLSGSLSVIATAVSLAMLLVVYVQRGVLQGANRFVDFSLSMGFEAVCRVGLGVGFATRFGAAGALGGTALGLALAALFNAWRFRVSFGPTRAPIALDAPRLARTFGGVGIGQLTLTVLTFYDVPWIKHAFDPRSAGLYAAAALVGRAVIAAISFVPTIVLPKATARAAAGHSPLPLLLAGLGLSCAVIAVAAGAAAVAPRSVVSLIAGRAFADAGPLVFTYVLASGALSLAGVVAAYNFGLHRYAFVAPAVAVAAAEAVTFVLWHPSLIASVNVLAVGHACVLLVALAGARTTMRAPAEETRRTRSAAGGPVV